MVLLAVPGRCLLGVWSVVVIGLSCAQWRWMRGSGSKGKSRGVVVTTMRIMVISDNSSSTEEVGSWGRLQVVPPGREGAASWGASWQPAPSVYSSVYL
jgi:hypothetical protein